MSRMLSGFRLRCGLRTHLACFVFKFLFIRDLRDLRGFNFGIRVCAGEAGCYAGASPAGRIGLFTTESWIWEEAARRNPKARSRLNRPVVTTVNLIE